MSGPAQENPILTDDSNRESVGNRDNQLAFLYKVLDDNQNTIRFLDAKAAFAVALLSAMIGKFIANIGDYFPKGAQPLWRQGIVLAFLLGAILAGVLVAAIVFPASNPSKNARLIANTSHLFFLHELEPKKWGRMLSRNPKYSRLANEHADYLCKMAAIDDFGLLQVVSAEVLKLSYIRQIKTDRFRALTFVLAFCALTFVSLMAADATHPGVSKPTVVRIEGPVAIK